MSYYWEGKHKIYIGTGRIKPANPRVWRPEISEKLIRYYEKAREAIEAKRRTLITRTLDGTVYAFVGNNYGRRRWVVVIKTHSPEFEVWEGWCSITTVYSAFMRSDACAFLTQKPRKQFKDGKAEDVLSTLRAMGFKADDLPKGLASSLAVAKLLDG